MHNYSLDDFLEANKRDDLISALCNADKINIQIQYTSEFKSAKVLREIVDNICKEYGVNPKWRTRLVLIIDELNNNAIEYGSKNGEDNYFSLIIESKLCNALFIEASVSDRGNGLHAKTAGEMEKLRDTHKKKDFSSHHSIRGRGLFLIITQLVDELYFKDNSHNGLTVGVRKTLPLE